MGSNVRTRSGLGHCHRVVTTRAAAIAMAVYQMSLLHQASGLAIAQRVINDPWMSGAPRIIHERTIKKINAPGPNRKAHHCSAFGPDMTSMSLNKHMHLHTHYNAIHPFTHTYTHTYIHTCIHTYIHTYIHTRAYIHAHSAQATGKKMPVHDAMNYENYQTNTTLATGSRGRRSTSALQLQHMLLGKQGSELSAQQSAIRRTFISYVRRID